MKTVSLFRHAKSSWADSTLADFDRPLNERGKKAATRMGAFMAKNGVMPGLVLCSSSVRTRATLKLALKAYKTAPETVFEDTLYHASSAALIASLRSLPPPVSHVMIVGHNPGLHALALDLFGAGERDLTQKISRKFPTAALAVIQFGITEWRRLSIGDGLLVRFITPKSLD